MIDTIFTLLLTHNSLLIAISALLFISILAYFRIADHFNIIDKPNQRSSHTGIIIRGGGIIFYVGMLLYSIFIGFWYPWFLAGLTLIAVISFMDDIKEVNGKLRLVVHFTAMALMFYEWGLFTGLPWWYIIIGLVFCTGIINAYNFMDGINGITGGYSLILLAALAWINLNMVHYIDPVLLTVAGISVIVFNIFNFRKKARCFAGDVGSVSIAFIIVFALGQLIITTSDLSFIILMAVYGVDSVLTIIHRLMLHENIFQAHRKHVYQLMANELKIPHVTVSLIYMNVQAAIIIGFILLFPYRWIYLPATLIILSIVYVVFMRKYFHLHLQRMGK